MTPHLRGFSFSALAEILIVPYILQYDDLDSFLCLIRSREYVLIIKRNYYDLKTGGKICYGEKIKSSERKETGSNGG